MDAGLTARTDWGSEPHVVDEGSVIDLVSHFVREGAQVRVMDLRAATRTTEVTEALRGVLDVPDWCGPGWDSVEDALSELAGAWPFSLLLLVEGLDRLVARAPQVSLETVLALDRLRTAFGQQRQQLEVAYVWRASASDFFVDLRLSVQRALWGVIPDSLRAVALGASGHRGTARFVFDEEPGEDELELVSEVLTEVIADFPGGASFEFGSEQAAGGPLAFEPGESWWAYVRAPKGV